MNKTLILIQASEGNTETVFMVHGGKSNLTTHIFAEYSNEIEKQAKLWYERWGDDSAFDRDYEYQLRDTLIKMVNNHEQWDNGRYILESVDPHWQEWTLIIADYSFADVQ